MKQISLSILVFFIFSTFLYCQLLPQKEKDSIQMMIDQEKQKENSLLLQADSLAIVQLEYEILDSNEINRLNVKKYKYKKIVTYEERCAYYTNNKNKWISFDLYYSDGYIDGLSIESINFINLDNIGLPEIILRIKFGTHGHGIGASGSYQKGMVIFKLDRIPTRIFKIIYCCQADQRSVPEDGVEGFDIEYKRKISIEHNKIIIGKLKNNLDPNLEECNITKIEEGIYIMKNGKIVKSE